jgi:hypothetical protein
MAVSRTTARVDSESAVHTLDRAIMQWPFLLVRSPINGQAPWARVIRHAQCADGGLDPDQWFPVSAEAGKARHEAAAAIAICTACRVPPNAWRCHCGTGISASTVFGAAWSLPDVRRCAAGACGLNPQGLCDLWCTRMGKGEQQ